MGKRFSIYGCLLTAGVVACLLYPRLVISDTVIRDPAGARPISDSYFGMHVRWGASTPYWPQARFHTWRVITGETTWYGLEKENGVWRFEALDRAVAAAGGRGVEVLYTLGYPPKWAVTQKHQDVWNPGVALPPQDMHAWENYVRLVVERYKGRIKYYELMNEPHFTEVDGAYSKVHFPVATMVEMARIASRVIKQVDPEAKLVSMSPSGAETGIRRIEAFLKAGGGRYVDVIGFHFYTNGFKSGGPEEIPVLVGGLQKVLRDNGHSRLDIWNTESGFYINGPGIPAERVSVSETMLEPVIGGAIVARSHILGAAAGLRRFYWYSWDIPGMALTEDRGRIISPAGKAYIATQRWLRGATINECRTADDKLWVCSLNRAARKAHMVWNVAGARDWLLPAEWQARRYETLQGRAGAVDSAGRIQVDEAPMLIVSDDLPWGAP